MLKALLLPLMTALAAMATAQNLVLNGSFEDTIDCEIPTQCLLRKAAHWYNPNTATPDIWDCDLERQCGFEMAPTGPTAMFYQPAFEGLRYAGAYYWFGPGSSNTRDYLMTRLEVPLTTGAAYQVSLRYVLRRTYEFAVDHIGVWFGSDSLYEAQPGWLNVTPQVKLRDPQHPYLAETEVWTLLKDTLVAAGDEQWLVIGNFAVADSVNGISAYPDALNEYAYYFIDSVSVKEIDMASSVAEPGISSGWLAEGLWVRWPLEMRVAELELFDAAGRKIAAVHTEPSMGYAQVHMPPLAPGMYVLQAIGRYRRLCIHIIKGEGEF